MKIKCWAVLAFILLETTPFFGQDFDDYSPIKCVGEIPVDISLPAQQLFQKELAKDYNKRPKDLSYRSHQEFMLNNTYSLDWLMTRGSVLFGDPLTEYVNHVADNLLVNEPELRSELRFYCLRSSVTNAFTTNSGMIFVSIALLSQLENESQLAFILSHEISHYKNKHVINSYRQQKNISKNNRYNNSDDVIRHLSNYSKDQEFEADSMGFMALLDSDFNIKECLSSFNVLQYSNLPFELHEFDKTFLNTENCKIPDYFFPTNSNPIEFNEQIDDEYSSHPNIGKRKARIMGLEKQFPHAQGSNQNSLTAEYFELIRKTARFELVNINIIERNFIQGLYQAHYLLKENPNSEYLQNLEISALYGIAKYSRYNYNNETVDYEDVQGEISIPFYLFEELDLLAKKSLILRYIWDKSLQDPNNVLINSYLENLVLDIINNHNTNISDYIDYQDVIAESKIKNDSTSVADAVEMETENATDKPLSKYDQLKIEQYSKDDLTDVQDSLFQSRFYLNAFEGCKEMDSLKDLFIKMSGENMNEESTILVDLSSKKIGDDQIKTNNLLIVDPILVQLNTRNQYDLKNSLETDYLIEQNLSLLDKELSMNLNVLNPKSAIDFNVQNYNDLASLNSWFYESQIHKKHRDVSFVNSQNPRIQKLLERYNCDYFAFIYQLNYFEPSKLQSGIEYYIIAAFVAFPPAWPILYARYFKNKGSKLNAQIYEGLSGQLVCEYDYNSKFHMNSPILKAILGEMLNNLNH